MTTQAPVRETVQAVIGSDGVVICQCGRFLLKLEDATMLAILRAAGVRFHVGACKNCKHRAVIDFGYV